ncbi:MAG TPA: chromosome segregation protein SMC [Candidatus Binatia bacterium]|nr:chromosome segregation protein SMC [Candidatus Binatia bacterium]
MYLKNLTILGFKSFADKTSLNFQPGVTAIVGPNGCGKSNVSDAIRWVLGEQSAKALRGGEMADVIFTGTDGRKPLGMAEVSLTIGGFDQEHLKASGVDIAYNEVTITRRVFRDGNSEYFINKTGCRLKDIQQLFMGTGVGRTSYSIMAQGNITQILSSKPEDRRLVFEEAAGITKFKAQKKEALRKLEYTEQNLLRVSDLIREVKRQIGSLQRQAGKARRYKAIAIELQHLDTQLARHQFDVLQTEINERQELAEKLRLDIEVANETVLRVENEIGQLRDRIAELDEDISGSQQRSLELKAQGEQHESRIGFNEERLQELAAQHGKALTDITQAEERRRAAEDELASVTERLAASQSALERHRAELQRKHEALHQVEAQLSQGQEQLRVAQAACFSAAQTIAKLRNEINALDLEKQGNIVRLEKLSAEKIQLEEERARLEGRLQEFAANVQAEKLSMQSSRGTVEQRQARLREIQSELTDVGQELDGLLHRQAESRSRLHVLEQLEAGHEGFSDGTLAALQKTEAVLGSLADKIRVPDQYVAAIEAALGHHLQLVLTERPDAAQEILNDLSANKRGRASIAPLEFARNGHSNFGDDGRTSVSTGHNGNAQPVRAASVVSAEEPVKLLVDRLLGGTRIVPDLASATMAWEDSKGAFHFVTLGGELLSAHGIYTGGYANGAGKAPGSILGRKNQITDLESAVAELQNRIAELSRRKGALQSEYTELQATLQQAQTELRAQEVAIATQEGEFKMLEGSLQVLRQKIETVAYELESLAAHDQEGLEKRAALVAQTTDAEAREETFQDQVATLTAELEGLRAARETANGYLTETKVSLAAEEQLCTSFRQQQQPLQQRIGELVYLADQRRQEIGAFAQRKVQWETEIDESRRLVEKLQHEREFVNARTAESQGQRDAVEQQLHTREEGLREERKRLADIQTQRGTIDVELAQKAMAVQNLRERIQQKYQVNLDDVRSECITITIVEEGPPRVQTLTPDEMAAAGAATDWTAVAEQVTALQRRLDEIGPVNLVAIEEYEETEQRHQFLTTQHDDLVKAKDQLMEIINRINVQTREMFTETFEKIRENFRLMFTEVFGGGKADLLLVNDGDVLDSGIDIVARPPGKQLQSISLLSGGEQTMTAVALLFSIYQVKPSPFCVLDELDAPLDESNINRFIKVLQRFLTHSQFVIITHNKRTIGMADILYGVTMQEHGVSKIVSVKFHKAEDPQLPANRVLPGEAESENGAHPFRIEMEDVVMVK